MRSTIREYLVRMLHYMGECRWQKVRHNKSHRTTHN
jgi:hypothetical protein